MTDNTLIWASEKPQSTGWYWSRVKDVKGTELIRYIRPNQAWPACYEFAGPIPLPEEPHA